MRPPTRPPVRYTVWRRQPAAVRCDEEFIQRVLSLWHDGHDTYTIAQMIFEEEATVVIALHVGRERERSDQCI